MVGGSNGYRAALARRQLTPGQISSSPETAGLRLFISFSTSYAELDSARATSYNVDGERVIAVPPPSAVLGVSYKRQCPETPRSCSALAGTWAEQLTATKLERASV